MWSKFPIIGWFLAILFSIFSAIPFYFLWNYIAPKYLSFIPELYQQFPFWDIVWIFMTISIVKHILLGGIFNMKNKTEIKNE